MTGSTLAGVTYPISCQLSLPLEYFLTFDMDGNVFKFKRILFRYRLVYRWTFAVGRGEQPHAHARSSSIYYVHQLILSLGSRTRQNNLFGRCQCIIQQVIGCVKKRKEKSRRSSWCCRPAILFGLWRWVAHCNAPDNTRRSNKKFFSFSAAFAFAIDRCTHTHTPHQKLLLKSNYSVPPPFLQKKKTVVTR